MIYIFKTFIKIKTLFEYYMFNGVKNVEKFKPYSCKKNFADNAAEIKVPV